MNAKLYDELVALVKAHKWQELLRSLPAGEPVPLTFDAVEDMNNIRSVASRLNSMGQDECRYSFSGLNYSSRILAVTAIPKN